MKSSSGKTILESLIEIFLVAIAFFILLILIGSFFGGYHRFPADLARRASAKNDAVQIAGAITGFHTEYGRFPWTNAGIQDVGGPGLQALMGLDTNINPRQIVFLEVQTARKGKGGLTNGIYVDPWGFAYKMKLDIDGDKRINDVGPAFSQTAVVANTIAAVWNDPDHHPDRTDPEKKKKRAVNSWR